MRAFVTIIVLLLAGCTSEQQLSRRGPVVVLVPQVERFVSEDLQRDRSQLLAFLAEHQVGEGDNQRLQVRHSSPQQQQQFIDIYGQYCQQHCLAPDYRLQSSGAFELELTRFELLVEPCSPRELQSEQFGCFVEHLRMQHLRYPQHLYQED